VLPLRRVWPGPVFAIIVLMAAVLAQWPVRGELFPVALAIALYTVAVTLSRATALVAAALAVAAEIPAAGQGGWHDAWLPVIYEVIGIATVLVTLDDYVYAGLRAGASGFLLKDTQPANLVAAIRTIAAGDAVLAPGATSRLVRQFAATEPAGPPGGQHNAPLAGAQIKKALTGREQDVFSGIAAGKSNSEIAASLDLSEGTVKIHVGRILAKLGLRDRVQAVVLAYESRLVTPGTPAPGGPGHPH
jgi:DNA-binding CsgD family transcriptional regulator